MDHMNDRLGTIVRDGDRLRLRFERHLAQPPDKVWRALTESSGLRHWFPADIVGQRAPGASVQLPFWPEGAQESLATLAEAGVDTTTLDLDKALPGRIQAFDPPRLFELVWGNPDGEADVLRFELEPDGAGTRLVFTTWPGQPGPLGHAGTAAGWHACLGALESLMDGHEVEGPDRQSVHKLQQVYAGMIT